MMTRIVRALTPRRGRNETREGEIFAPLTQLAPFNPVCQLSSGVNVGGVVVAAVWWGEESFPESDKLPHLPSRRV